MPSWLADYRRAWLPGDLLAALVVAVMLIPQAMAYAMLAGLPPQSGLYAAILPLAVYAWFCSSRYLAVGPVALICLMTASILTPGFQPGTPGYAAAALGLALLTGLILLVTGLLRFGALVSYLSHPVLSGFTSAAAIIIALSQLGPLLGVTLDLHGNAVDALALLLPKLGSVHLPTVAVSGLSLALLLLSRTPLARLLRRLALPEPMVTALTKTGALLLVLLAILGSGMLDLGPRYGVRLVGSLPAALPSLSLPPLERELLGRLLPGAALLALVAFVSSISVARSLASKHRQKVSGNRELVALGLANLGAAFSGAFPVAGGFSRSAVNFSAGANTPLASVLTALLVALATLLL
ncbi:MAG: sodium-independent anion transporter, partial [Gammaproteobacteria bacterium]